MIGFFLGWKGEVVVLLLGGCNIGVCFIDFYVWGLEVLGVKVDIRFVLFFYVLLCCGDCGFLFLL